MTRPSRPTPSLRLHTEVLIWRQGYVWVLASVLLLVSGAALLAQRYLLQPRLLLQTQALSELQSSLDAMRRAKDTAVAPAPDPFVAAQASLRSVMLEREALPALIRTLHETALRHRISVLSSDYQLKEQGRNGVLQQTVTLPMRVGYAPFKAFLLDVLRSHPGIAVDQISIKREAVAQATPEIVLRLSVWVVATPDPVERTAP